MKNNHEFYDYWTTPRPRTGGNRHMGYFDYFDVNDFIMKNIMFWTSRNQDHIKIISNPPATILFVGDKKTVVKAYNEPYDTEKGIAMAILKHLGLSRADMRRLIDNTIVQVSKVPEMPTEDKLEPDNGEYIRF